jgi:hypothetical protein
MVVDELAGNLDVLVRFADVIDGTVMTFSVALEGDACVFRSVLNNLIA